MLIYPTLRQEVWLIQKLLEEARLKEKEINDRLSSKNEEIAKTKEKLEVLRTDKDRLVGVLASLDIELEYCEDEKNSNQNILESIISKRVEKEEKVKSLSDKLSGLKNQNNYLVAQSEQVNIRHTELVQTLESRQEMLGSAHVPNWHYLPDYGWLWTSLSIILSFTHISAKDGYIMRRNFESLGLF